MASLSGTVALYTVLIAPGFVAVMTAITLSAIERTQSRFVLLVWSVVSSIIIDTIGIAVYQHFHTPINTFGALSSILFTPRFRSEYVLAIFLLALIMGFIYSLFILAEIPEKFRAGVQHWSAITYNPRQPWQNFMREAGSIRIKTHDDEFYAGDVSEYSRAGRDRQVRIKNPHLWQPDNGGYQDMGREDMLFMEDGMDRILNLSRASGSVVLERSD